MLNCWTANPQDRPTFFQLRNKFSTLLQSTSGNTYIVLEVDEDKNYYTMAGEEEEEFERERCSLVADNKEGEFTDSINKSIWGNQKSNSYNIVTLSTCKV